MSPFQSRLSMTGIELPVGACIGVTERLDLLNKTSVRRTLNGAPVVLTSRWAKKWKVSLQAGGAAVRWAPAFDAVRPGDVVTLACVTYWTARVPAGLGSVMLSRPPVEGSVKAFLADDPRERPLPLSVAGTTVTLDAVPQSTVAVRFRPLLQALVVSTNLGSSEIEGTQSWGMELEEV